MAFSLMQLQPISTGGRYTLFGLCSSFVLPLIAKRDQWTEFQVSGGEKNNIEISQNLNVGVEFISQGQGGFAAVQRFLERCRYYYQRLGLPGWTVWGHAPPPPTTPPWKQCPQRHKEMVVGRLLCLDRGHREPSPRHWPIKRERHSRPIILKLWCEGVCVL